MKAEAPFEKEALAAVSNQLPVRDLPGVRIRAVKAQPEDALRRAVRTPIRKGQRSGPGGVQIGRLAQAPRRHRSMDSPQEDASLRRFLRIDLPGTPSQLAELLHRARQRFQQIGESAFRTKVTEWNENVGFVHSSCTVSL
jgi:hypothetical protein